MRTKILTYANDGNTVCNKYYDIEPLNGNENIFITPLEEYNRTNLIFKFKDVYYNEGSYQVEQLKNGYDKVQEHYTNYIANIPKQKFIKTIFIELYNLIGIDPAEIVQIKAEQLNAKEVERSIREAEKLRLANESNAKRQVKLEEEKIKFMAGEKIDKDAFLELLKLNNIPIHIRTLGMINDMNRMEIGINQAYVYGPKNKGKCLDKIFTAAKQLKEQLQTKQPFID